MIVDEILYAERFYRERYRQEKPKTLLISYDYYEELCQELGVDELDVFHGMTLEITNDVETFLIDEEEIFTEDEEF